MRWQVQRFCVALLKWLSPSLPHKLKHQLSFCKKVDKLRVIGQAPAPAPPKDPASQAAAAAAAGAGGGAEILILTTGGVQFRLHAVEVDQGGWGRVGTACG